MQMQFIKLREKYPNFYFHNYEIIDNGDNYEIIYYFEIPGLKSFTPKTIIAKKQIINNDYNYISYLVFHMGLVELISYWKCTCSPNVIVEAGFLDNYQCEWFKKLYFYGLGEFFFVNNIKADIETFMNLSSTGANLVVSPKTYQGQGNLVAIGGGKDSAVSLELLKGQDNTCFMINPKEPSIKCVEASGLREYFSVTRIIDVNLLELNKEGYLNGHTPFSALLAFTSFLSAYLLNKKYIVLSNEGSANEATVIGTKINHQYSKTYEFECDFNEYVSKYFKINIKYFSLLRPLNEFQIGLLFSHYKKYHTIFKSCNVGSKSTPWVWCGKCPKCLFVYIILSPFLTEKEMVNIFGQNLYQNQKLLKIFIELAGYAETKPFECVGTYNEVRYAISLCIQKHTGKLPYLLKYFQDHYPLELTHKFENDFNNLNNLDNNFLKIVKKELERYV